MIFTERECRRGEAWAWVLRGVLVALAVVLVVSAWRS